MSCLSRGEAVGNSLSLEEGATLAPNGGIEDQDSRPGTIPVVLEEKVGGEPEESRVGGGKEGED